MHILSDLHLEFGHIDIPKVEADCVILAGDVHVGRRGLPWIEELFPDTPVFYVLGNHEFYKHATPKLMEKMKSLTRDSHIRVLEKDVVAFQGVRILGATLWSDFEILGDRFLSVNTAADVMRDYKKIRVSPKYHRLRPNDAIRFHLATKRWLKEELAKPFDGPTVVVTHHAPGLPSVEPYFREDPCCGAYASDLSELIHAYKPALWIHGHTHFSCDYFIGDTRVISNPRGYVDEPVEGFSPSFVLEI